MYIPYTFYYFVFSILKYLYVKRDLNRNMYSEYKLILNYCNSFYSEIYVYFWVYDVKRERIINIKELRNMIN